MESLRVSNDPVRWGILGLAGSSHRMVRAMTVAANARLVAVATQRPGVTDQLRQTNPDLAVYQNYEQLLADARVEAVYIPLPNSFHAKWTMKAAAAGKHILCDKPLATSLEAVELMLQAAQQRRVQLMESFSWRFHPQHARVKALLAAGAIGEPRVLRIGLSYMLDRSVPSIRLNPALGGGATWDIGCYALSAARFLFGAEPLMVMGTATFDAQTDVDLSLTALLTFPGDRVALVDGGMNYVPRGEYEVIGTTGRLRVERFWLEPDTPARVVVRDATGQERIETIPPANHFALEIEHFSRAVRGQGRLCYGPRDALAQARALVALRRGFESGGAEEP